ncbi:MAG: response regulator [Thermodesulfobacteriota bacterium]
MSITVLLADDHAVVRDGLKLLLETQGDLQVVAEATDGRQAVRRVAHLCPRVAILDISMPELNGIEATRQIKEASPKTQVIILSMHSSSEYIFQALRAGARGYLLKEAAGIEVIQAVRAVNSGKRYLSQKITDLVVDEYLRHGEAAAGDSPLERLAPREREVLQLVAEGKSTSQIAQILPLSPKTVETYRSRLMKKLGLKDLPGLIKFALQHGLSQVE